MKKINLFRICLFAGLVSFSTLVSAEETKMEKLETQKNETVDNVKSTYRDAKDKACEMVDGKTQCLGKKIRNKAKSMSDKTKTEGIELKNKID